MPWAETARLSTLASSSPDHCAIEPHILQVLAVLKSTAVCTVEPAAQPLPQQFKKIIEGVSRVEAPRRCVWDARPCLAEMRCHFILSFVRRDQSPNSCIPLSIWSDRQPQCDPQEYSTYVKQLVGPCLVEFPGICTFSDRPNTLIARTRLHQVYFGIAFAICSHFRLRRSLRASPLTRDPHHHSQMAEKIVIARMPLKFRIFGSCLYRSCGRGPAGLMV